MSWSWVPQLVQYMDASLVVSTQSTAQKFLDQTVIFCMSADPIPDGSVPPENGEGAILQADADRIDVIFAFEFLEMQTGVSGICLEKRDTLASHPPERRQADS